MRQRNAQQSLAPTSRCAEGVRKKWGKRGRQRSGSRATGTQQTEQLAAMIAAGIATIAAGVWNRRHRSAQQLELALRDRTGEDAPLVLTV